MPLNAYPSQLSEKPNDEALPDLPFRPTELLAPCHPASCAPLNSRYAPHDPILPARMTICPKTKTLMITVYGMRVKVQRLCDANALLLSVRTMKRLELPAAAGQQSPKSVMGPRVLDPQLRKIHTRLALRPVLPPCSDLQHCRATAGMQVLRPFLRAHSPA